MKKTTRVISLLLALMLIISAVMGTLTSCGGDKPPCTSHTDTDGDKKCDSCGAAVGSEVTPPGEKTNYTVNVKTIGGMPVSGAVITVYNGDDLDGYATTDENGNATVSLYARDGYTIKLSGAPAGYEIADSYSFEGRAANITLVSRVNPNTGLSGVAYKLGDVMRDFTVTTTDGKTFTLSEVLKTKKAVLLNFWYTTCSWCITEFPYMEAAYQNYSDDIAIIALDPYTSDSVDDISTFKATNGLTFDMAQEKLGLATAFGVTGYPTSVMIDRYGVICFIEGGAITAEKYFNVIFDHFAAENYEQKLIVEYEDLAPQEKPNIEQPSSEEIGAAINGAGTTVTYYPEKDSADAEYSWPFVLLEKDGVKYLVPTNSKKDSSYSTIHVDVALDAGEAVAFDYISSTEEDADILYVLINGEDVQSISGISDGIKSCYAYVAPEAGTYKMTLIYLKDDSVDEGDDKVYIRNMRTCPSDAIDTPTYIPFWAATEPYEDGTGYGHYATVVLGEDGYYHVGSATGPLLLANLMGYTPFSGTSSAYMFVYNATAEDTALLNIAEAFTKYCSYATNSKKNGLCTVNEELAGYLKTICEAVGIEEDNPNEWLQFCLYYDAYGTGGAQLADPIIGLAPHSAYPTILNSEVGLEEYPNVVTYDRVIMPRGLWYAFTPKVSGAYRIVSNVPGSGQENSLAGWIFLEDGSIYYQHAISERILDDGTFLDGNNVRMHAYFEAGKTYYIDIAYDDPYKFDSFAFKIEYLGEDYTLLRSVSPGAPFTYEIDEEGNITNLLIAGGVRVKLGEDGYYYNILPDGTMGTSKIYVDFTMLTSIFSENALCDMIDRGAFDFSKSEGDHYALLYTDDQLRTLWGEDFESNYDYFKIAEARAGIYHGDGEDRTETVREYFANIYDSEDEGIPSVLYGTVAVNEELGEILQALMDKYTFKDVENSWVKLCYYFEYIGEGWTWINEMR